MSQISWRQAARAALVVALAAAATAALTLPGRADEQRTARLGLALYAMPTSLGLSDVNQRIDELNTFTSGDPFNLAPIGKITWGSVFGVEGRYFATRKWVVHAGFGRILRQSRLDLQPQAAAFTLVKAKVLTVPRYIGADYYFEPRTRGDFTIRPFVGGGFMDLSETKVVFGGSFTSPDTTFGQIEKALGEGSGVYVEGGIHMMFPSKYSVLLNGHYRNARVNRLYDEQTGQLLLDEVTGQPLTANVSGFGLRLALQINILGKTPE